MRFQAALASLTVGHFTVFCFIKTASHMQRGVMIPHSVFLTAYKGLKRLQSLSNEGPVVIWLYPVTLISASPVLHISLLPPAALHLNLLGVALE